MTQTTMLQSLDDVIESGHNFAYAMELVKDPQSCDELYEGLRMIQEEFCRNNTMAAITMMDRFNPGYDNLTILAEDGFRKDIH